MRKDPRKTGKSLQPLAFSEKKITFMNLNQDNLRPDFPYKVFSDKRNNYVLLMVTLAEDGLLYTI